MFEPTSNGYNRHVANNPLRRKRHAPKTVTDIGLFTPALGNPFAFFQMTGKIDLILIPNGWKKGIWWKSCTH
jgi:hypothetical protein